MTLFQIGLGIEFAAALITVIVLLVIAAPYGRHLRPGWGPGMDGRSAWIIMEGTAVVAFLLAFAQGGSRGDVVPRVFFCLWMAHYLYRSAVYPFLVRRGGRMPVLIVVMGMAFNALNGWLNARWVGHLGVYEARWMATVPFVVGVVLMAMGFMLHVHSDEVLRKLRNAGEQGYRVPHGGLHRWVSNPNYLGEIIEWSGWAVATWSLPGLAFALFSLANLAPRAVANRRWCRAHIEGYPRRRKALIPGLL